MKRLRSTIAFVVALVLVAGTPAEAEGARPSPQRLERDATSDPVVRSRADGTVSWFRGSVPAGTGGPTARARAFLDAYGPAFGVRDERTQLARVRTSRDDLGLTHVRFEQRYRGLRVVGRQVIVHLRGDEVVSANGDLVPVEGLPITPAISASAAAGTALRAHVARAPRPSAAAPELVVFADGARRPHLAWLVTVVTAEPVGLWRTYVDARSGRLLRTYDDLRTVKDRAVYDAGNVAACNTDIAPACTLPGALARAEGAGETGDAVIDALYDHLGTAYDYFWDTFGIDSFDDDGHQIRASAHFGVDFANAFWCPLECAVLFGAATPQLVFGNGDGVWFGELATDPHVVIHEYGHAVTDAHVGFEYFDQSGALDESYADLFAYFATGIPAIGAATFTPGIEGDALRNLDDPAAGGDPAHMDDYVRTIWGGGGVHTNSLIPSHAAYLAATHAAYGVGIPAVEQIYFRALTEYLTPSADFLDNLNALIAAASDLYGPGSDEVEAIVRGHAAVGIVNAPVLRDPVGGATLRGGVVRSVSWTNGGADALNFRLEHAIPSANPVYTQGFESTSVPSGFATSGDAPWVTTTGDAWSGNRSIRSGAIGDAGRSELTLTRTLVAPGTLTFIYRVSSEEWGDFFSFFINGEFIGFDTGDRGWQFVEIDVPAGRHRFTWLYEKDDDSSDGDDAVFLDDLVLTNSPATSWSTVVTTAAGATSTSWTTPTTSSANYRVRLRAAPSTAAIGYGEEITGPITIDAAPPVGVRVRTALKPWQLAGTASRVSFGMPLQGSDALTGVASFDVRWRYGYDDTGFTPFEPFLVRTTLRNQNVTIGGSGADLRGLTMCFGARARDGVGNLSAYSAQRCTAVPLNDNQLAASSGWTRRTGQSGHYLNSFRQTRRQGVTLRSDPVRARRIVVIATTCSDCGTIEVLRGSTVLKRVSLRTSKTRKRQVIAIKNFSSIQSPARLTIRVVSSDRLVRIEGLGVSLG